MTLWMQQNKSSELTLAEDNVRDEYFVSCYWNWSQYIRGIDMPGVLRDEVHNLVLDLKLLFVGP